MNGQPLIAVDLPRSRLSKGLWTFAATIALTFHMALAAFAILHAEPETEDDDLGAVGLEIAFEIAAPQALPVNLPPGPESEASQASPPIVQETVETKQADLPMDKPVEAENPDRLVTLNNTKTPSEQEPEVKTQKANPSEQSAAQEAMAPPASVSIAPQSTTREQGIGESYRRARMTWQKELAAHLDRFKRYPAEREDKRVQVVVSVEFDRTGQVLAANITKSSGDSAFDAAAVAMVQRANPVPPPPPLVADQGLSFTLPVNFGKSGTH